MRCSGRARHRFRNSRAPLGPAVRCITRPSTRAWGATLARTHVPAPIALLVAPTPSLARADSRAAGRVPASDVPDPLPRLRRGTPHDRAGDSVPAGQRRLGTGAVVLVLVLVLVLGLVLVLLSLSLQPLYLPRHQHQH